MKLKLIHEMTLEILRKYEFPYAPEDTEEFVEVFVGQYNKIFDSLLKQQGLSNPHSGMSGLDYVFTFLGDNIKID